MKARNTGVALDKPLRLRANAAQAKPAAQIVPLGEGLLLALERSTPFVHEVILVNGQGLLHGIEHMVGVDGRADGNDAPQVDTALRGMAGHAPGKIAAQRETGQNKEHTSELQS